MALSVYARWLERVSAKRLAGIVPQLLAIALTFAVAPATAQSGSNESIRPTQQGATSGSGKHLSATVAAWNLLAEEIRSHSRTHRSNAIAALVVIGPRRDVVALLEGALRDKDAEIRKEAATALGTMPAPASKRSLRACLHDESPDVALAAADALWQMGDRSGRDIVIDTLDGKTKGNGFVKGSMKSQLGKYRDPKQLAFKGATEAAGAFVGPLPIGITIAQELLKDRTAAARAACAQMLGKDPSPEAVEELTEARFDRNWGVRAAAAQALAVSPGRVSTDLLAPMLYDNHAAVRDIAAAGIIRRSQAPRPADVEWPVDEDETAEAKK